MDLLERYLQAVRFWLPRRQRADVVAELSEDIRSQIEQRESETGRAADETDLDRILRSWGNPLLVAGRYAPQRYLVGPALFPVYRFVLLIVLWYLVPWLLVWAGFVAFVPSYRAEHPGLALVHTLRPCWLLAVHWFALVTIGFAWLERSGAVERWGHDWSPRGLPAVRDPDRIGRGGSGGELAWHALLALWWVGIIRLPAISTAPDPPLRIALAPVWHVVYWPVLALFFAEIGLAIVNLWRPRWTVARARTRLAIDGSSLVLLAVLLGAGTWLHLESATALGPDLVRVATSLDWSVGITLALIALAYVVAAVRDVQRIVRLRPTVGGGVSGGVAGVG